jgi:hypothetical protein
MDASDTIVPLP